MGLSKLTCPKTNLDCPAEACYFNVSSNSINSDSTVPTAWAKNFRSHLRLLFYASDPIHQQFLPTQGLTHIQNLTSSHPFLLLPWSKPLSSFIWTTVIISNMISLLITLPHSHSLFHIAASVNLKKKSYRQFKSLMKKNMILLIDVERVLYKI